MTYQEIVAAIQQLNVQERLTLLELLARSVRLDLVDTARPIPLSEQLYSILDVGFTASDDAELGEDYAGYLLRKYA